MGSVTGATTRIGDQPRRRRPPSRGALECGSFRQSIFARRRGLILAGAERHFSSSDLLGLCGRTITHLIV
jgi:hypothetical protein